MYILKENSATGRTVGLQDSENLVSRDEANLGNSVRIPQCDTNLRWRKTFPRELGDLFNDLVGSGFEPGGRGAAVGECRARDTLSRCVHATHFEEFVCRLRLYLLAQVR